MSSAFDITDSTMLIHKAIVGAIAATKIQDLHDDAVQLRIRLRDQFAGDSSLDSAVSVLCDILSRKVDQSILALAEIDHNLVNLLTAREHARPE